LFDAGAALAKDRISRLLDIRRLRVAIGKKKDDDIYTRIRRLNLWLRDTTKQSLFLTGVRRKKPGLSGPVMRRINQHRSRLKGLRTAVAGPKNRPCSCSPLHNVELSYTSFHTLG
jgi:hypothetical protein